MNVSSIKNINLFNIFEDVAQRLKVNLEYDRISLTIKEKNRFLVVAVLTEENDTKIPQGYELPYEGTASFWCVKTQKGLVNHVQNDSYLENSLLKNSGFKSAMHVPIKFGGELIGTIDVFSLKENQYANTTLKLFQEYSNIFSTMIDNFYLQTIVKETQSLMENYSNRIEFLLRSIDYSNHKLEAIPIELFNGFDDAVFLIDLNYKIVKMNKSAIALLDISQLDLEKYLYYPIDNILNETNIDPLKSTFDKIIEDTIPATKLKIGLIDKHKNNINVFLSADRVLDTNGNTIGLVLNAKSEKDSDLNRNSKYSEVLTYQFICSQLKKPINSLYDYTMDLKDIPFEQMNSGKYNETVYKLFEQSQSLLKLINDIAKSGEDLKKHLPDGNIKDSVPKLIYRVPEGPESNEKYPQDAIQRREIADIKPHVQPQSSKSQMISAQPTQPVTTIKSIPQKPVTPIPETSLEAVPKEKKIGSRTNEIPPGKLGTVLVVDDNTETVDNLNEFLSDKGFHVLTASDGLEGLLMARDYLPDVVVVDMLVPKVNIMLFLKNLKRFDSIKNINPIVLTPFNRLTDIYKALESGAKDYILKPININQFEQKLMNIFNLPFNGTIEEPEEKLETDFLIDEGIMVIRLSGFMTPSRLNPLFSKIDDTIKESILMRRKILINLHEISYDSATPENLDALFNYFQNKIMIKPKDLKILSDNQDIIDNIKSCPLARQYEIVNDYINAYSKLQMGV